MSVVTDRSLVSSSSTGECVTTKTAMFERGACSHVRVHAALCSYWAEKSVEMHISVEPMVAYVRWRLWVGHLSKHGVEV